MAEHEEQWSDWIVCTRENPVPFQVGDYVTARAFIDGVFYMSAEAFVKDDDVPYYINAVLCCRPGLDWIEISIRRPRGMRSIQDILENLPPPVMVAR